jgi:hypothetical protein
MRSRLFRRHPPRALALFTLLSLLAPTTAVQADGPVPRLEAGQSLYRYDGDGRVEGVERRRDGAILRYGRNGELTGAARLRERTRPRHGSIPDRRYPGDPTLDPVGERNGHDLPDLFRYDGDGKLTGATRRYPNLPDDRPAPGPDPKGRDGR